jgi:EmrB/QacA subfamily drug resistance transporter
MTLTQRDKVYTLIGILMALFLGALDQTIVSTALPKIVEDLRGLDRFAWVATSYLLASTVLVPIYGKLADMYSRKSIELWAVGLFLAGSFLCGLAGEFGRLPLLGDGMNQLVLFRALQGIGGAGLFSLAFIIIADLYPPNVRGRYQGLVGATFGIASVLGPWIGGLLTDYGGAIIPGIEGWRWVFYVNVPFGAVAIWFIVSRMPQLKPSEQRRPLDLVSASFLILGLVPLILALQLDKTLYPWGGGVTLSLFAAALLFMFLFVARSLRSTNPILDLSLFRNPVFSIANAAVFFLGASFMVTIIFLPLFMVNVLGVSATRAGVSLIPLSLGMVFGAIVSGQLVSFIGRYRLLMLVGGAILTFGVTLLSRMTVDVGYWQVTLYMVICGLGVGPSLPLYTLAIQNAVDVRKVGQATSSSQFFRQIGGTVGAAIMGTVLATSLATSFASFGQAGLGEMATFSGGEFAASGGAGVSRQITSMFEQQYSDIAAAFRSGDTVELESVLAQSRLPEEARNGIRMGASAALVSNAASEGFLGELERRLKAQAQRLTQEVEGQIRVAFNEAITSIYRYLIAVVVIGWSITWFVPVLPLSGTLEQRVGGASE